MVQERNLFSPNISNSPQLFVRPTDMLDERKAIDRIEFKILPPQNAMRPKPIKPLKPYIHVSHGNSDIGHIFYSRINLNNILRKVICLIHA